MEDKLASFKTDKPDDYLPSIGEQIIAAYLEDRDIEFYREVVFDQLPFLRFDFYLPKYRLAIEFDGRQHFEVVEDFGDDEEKLKRRKRFDLTKNKFIFGSGGVLIRIRHDDAILLIFYSKLKKYFPNNPELYES